MRPRSAPRRSRPTWSRIAAERQRINARLLETGKLIHQSEAQLSPDRVEAGPAAGAGEAPARHARGAPGNHIGAAGGHAAHGPQPAAGDDHAPRRRARHGAQRHAAVGRLSRAQRAGDGSRRAAQGPCQGDGELPHRGRQAQGRDRRATTMRGCGWRRCRRRSASRWRSGRSSSTACVKVATQIARNVEDMSDLINRLDREVAARTDLGAYEKKAGSRRQRRTARPRCSRPIPRRWRCCLPAASCRTSPSPRPRGSCSCRPRAGACWCFGDKTQHGTVSKGLVVQTRHGGQVVSPCDGWIVYAGEFRTYGQLLIINAGSGYHMSACRLIPDRRAVRPVRSHRRASGRDGCRGQICPGDQDPGQWPHPYIELRKDGRPIDPDPWWSDASRKVQG